MVTDPQGSALVVPTIREDESFAGVSKKLAVYFIEAVDTPLGWEDLRSSTHVQVLQPLIDYLAKDCHNTAIVAALVALKGHFKAIESDDDCGINESRGFACELVAWQLVLELSEQDALEHLLFELHDQGCINYDSDDEETGLLSSQRYESANSKCGASRDAIGRTNGNANASGNSSAPNGNDQKPHESDGFTEPFMNLNTLEIATVAGAKKFLSQRAVQDIVDGIWNGNIVFWERLTPNAVKKPRFHSKKTGDLWCRLRVPRYTKTFEILFFVCFLTLFYLVCLQRVMHSVTIWEIFFYIFVLGFAFDEFDDFIQSGMFFYLTDIWSLWDIGIVMIGITFFVLRMIGLSTGNDGTLNWAFNILALHSLLLTPRIFSLLSLSPYYGSLLPCLKEMGKQFIRFLGFVLIIYLGFFSTFILLARGHFPLDTLSITVLKVFFGAGVVGFDIAPQLSPYLGLPVMIIFVCLTNQLLITSMMAHISNSLRQVLDSSREEYLYVYSVYVLEAVTSDKTTSFQPPLNLIPIVIFRPIFLLVSETTGQKIRIMLLKVTHAPLVCGIWCYEHWETLAIERKSAKEAALSLGIGASGTSTATPSKVQAKDPSAGSRTASVSKKHPLRKPGRVQVPTELLSQASKRPSKRTAAAQVTSIRANTAPAAVGRSFTSHTAAAPAVSAAPRQASVKDTKATTATSTLNPSTADMADMMRLLKELSAQVEEVRAALVKHDQGPSD